MPFPNADQQFRPGQSGNPAGYSRKRRISDALARLIDAGDKRAEQLALIVYAKATGQTEVLEGREPDLGWFRELRSMLGEDGFVPEPQEKVESPRIVVPDVDVRYKPDKPDPD